jgi:hypothetical protein
VEHNVRVMVELPAALSHEQYRRVVEVQPHAAEVTADAGGVAVEQ